MQSNKYFGEYYPVESSIHKLSVFSKLITLLLMLIPIIASKSIELHLVMLFFILILIYSSKVPLRFYFDIIYGLRYIFVIFVVVLAFKGLELEDAVLQRDVILTLCELSDIIGAIESYIVRWNLNIKDLKNFSDKTKLAFKEGTR